MKKILLLFIVLVIVGCKPEEKIGFTYIDDFNWNVLDSLQYQKKPLSYIFDSNLPHVLYISNNECAECIYKFIKFNDAISNIDENIRYFYIITGCNNITFSYYLKENNVIIKDNAYLIMDSLDIFYQNMSKYLGDQIFVLKENKEVIQLLSTPIKNEETLKRFQELIKQK